MLLRLNEHNAESFLNQRKAVYIYDSISLSHI